MKKKPQAVGETAAPYSAKPAVKGKAAPKEEKAGVRYLDTETAQKLTKEIFDKHQGLFRKLAQ